MKFLIILINNRIENGICIVKDMFIKQNIIIVLRYSYVGNILRWVLRSKNLLKAFNCLKVQESKSYS